MYIPILESIFYIVVHTRKNDQFAVNTYRDLFISFLLRPVHLRWVKIATPCIVFSKSSFRNDGTFTQVNQYLCFIIFFLRTFFDCSCLIRPLFIIIENKISLLSECSCICECWFCGQVGQEHHGFEKC